MRQQEFNRSVGQVIQADSVIQEFGGTERGRALTSHERRALNQDVRKVALALRQSGGLVWKTLHRAVGVSSVEEMRIADLPAAQTVLSLLREEAEMIGALTQAREAEKQAHAAMVEMRAEIEALKQENGVMRVRLEAAVHDAKTADEIVAKARALASEGKRNSAARLFIGGCFTVASATAIFLMAT
ncbi:hypothetical protein H0A70_05255 [Alcaligenaceae bacterium]|nr:hypothetical protein [Alcaligenaceae bacterium]